MTLKKQLSLINDDYLLNISNVGLLKRALKEADNCHVTLTIEEEELISAFSDGIIVKIKNTLGNYNCSCPSRTICKHVLITLIKASKDVDKKEIVGDFTYLLNISQEDLLKEYGKKNYNNIIAKVMRKEIIIIKEDNALLISLANGFTVQFLSNKEAVCNCKKNNCLHKLEAIMQYSLFKEGELKYKIVEDEVNIDRKILENISDFITEIFQIGLFRLPSYYSERCVQLSLVCHREGLVLFEKMFNALSQDLLLYEQKNISFNKYSLLKNLSQIYLQSNDLLKTENLSLAEKLKQKYWDLPKIEIFGIGLTNWYVKTGYCGVTAIFFCPNIQKNVTFTLSRRVNNESEAINIISSLLLTNDIWNTTGSFQKLSLGAFTLSDGKISDDNRLSSSEKSKANIISNFSGLENVKGIIYEDFSLLSELFPIDLIIKKCEYVILKPARIEKGSFDKINQVYRCKLIDRYKNFVFLTIAYNKINEIIIKNLEHYEKKKNNFEAITVQISIVSQDNNAIVFPVAIWNKNKIYNLCDSLED